MNVLSLPSLRLDYVLGTIGAVLLLLLVWPWLQSPAAVKTSGDASEQSAAAMELPAIPPLTRFSAIGERPLFSPSRRPVAGEKVAPVGPGIEQRYRLLGLLNAGDTRRALLGEGKRRFALSEGAMLEGWRLTRIEHDRIVLSSPAGEAVLQLQPAAAAEGWADPPPIVRPTIPERAPEKVAPEKSQH